MTVSLTEPPVVEGTCPTCKGVLALNDAGQVPEHRRVDRIPSRRCPTSGWLGRDPHPRTWFFREGPQWL